MTSQERDAVRTVGFLLTPPGRRCYHTFARNGFDREICLLDPRACRWCLVGALLLVARHMKVPEGRLTELVSERLTQRKVAPLAALWDCGTDRRRNHMLNQLRTA